MKWNGLPLIIFGSGGISKEIYSLIKLINAGNYQQKYEVIGFVEVDSSKIGEVVIDGYTVVTCDKEIEAFASNYAILGAVIPVGTPKLKYKIYDSIEHINNFVYPNIIHPSVQIDHTLINFGMGNIITSGVNLTCDIRIGNFNLINLNSTIGHDTIIGNFNVINPLSAVSGNVIIKDRCLLGTGSKVLQQLTVEDDSTIGAGAVVVKDVEANSTVVGIPAKKIQR